MSLELAVLPGPGGLEFEVEFEGGFVGALLAGVGLEVLPALFPGVVAEAEAMGGFKKKRGSRAKRTKREWSCY